MKDKEDAGLVLAGLHWSVFENGGTRKFPRPRGI
jgi:hypothetical protein